MSAITNIAGQVVERYSYNAYGVRTVKNPANVVIAKSVVGNDRGFTSYKLDAEMGLYAARARMYSAKLGRFIGRDSSGYIDGSNLYSAYFAPLFFDPTGNTIYENYSPTSATAAPWTDKTIQTPANRVGETIARAWATCNCAPCGTQNIIESAQTCPTTQMVECTLNYKGHIYLDVAKINSFSGATVSGYYGHEQKHMQSVLDFLHRLKGIYESETGICDGASSCAASAKNIAARMTADINAYATAETHHQNGATGGPSNPNGEYPPIGSVPKPTPAPQP